MVVLTKVFSDAGAFAYIKRGIDKIALCGAIVVAGGLLRISLTLQLGDQNDEILLSECLLPSIDLIRRESELRSREAFIGDIFR